MHESSVSPFCDPSDTPSDLRLTIVYDDKSAGKNAWQTLQKITNRLTGKLRLEPKLWRFDLLEDPVCFSLALTDACSADMLVISLTETDTFTPTMQRWLAACLPKLKENDTAIVTIFDETAQLPNRAKSSARQFFREQAHQMGLSFFSTELSFPRPNLN